MKFGGKLATKTKNDKLKNVLNPIYDFSEKTAMGSEFLVSARGNS